jgi:hypothetical protein
MQIVVMLMGFKKIVVMLMGFKKNCRYAYGI